MTTQVFNDELMNLISTDFQRRYEPNFSWGNVMAFYQQLPGLIGFWPGVTGTPAIRWGLRDLSGAGEHMGASASQPNENADSTGLRRWVNFNGSTNYFSIADSAWNSILGTHSGINASIRGLTVMAWVRPADAVGSNGTVGSKWNGATSNRSWLFQRNTTGNVQLLVSSSGSATAATVTSTNALAQNEWRFVAGRFTPSAQIRVWEGFTYGLVTNENATSIPATLFDSAANLAVGAINVSSTPANFWNGDLSLIALCRAALPDLFIESIFNLTRPLFIRR